MVRPIDRSSSPPAQPESSSTTESTSVQKESAPQQSEGSAAPAAQQPQQSEGKALSAEGRGARLTEHSMGGQARQAQLQSQLPAGGRPAGSADTATPTSASSTGPAAHVEQPALKQGSRGPEVEQLQQKLNDWRTQQGQERIGEDGKYGDQTRRAVRDFQQANGLTGDGQAGGRTQDRLRLETDPNFRSVNPQTQQQVRDLMQQNSVQTGRRSDTPEQQAARSNLLNLATDPNFARLSTEGQNQALARFRTAPTDATQTQSIRDTVRDRANLENNPNFQGLNADTRQQALTMLENNHGNSAARTNIANLATDPNFGRLSRTHQDETLRALGNNVGDARQTQALRNLVGSDHFRSMSDALKSRTIGLANTHAANPAYTESLDRLIRHDRFGSFSTQDQGRLLNVFENTTPRGQEALQNLMSRDIGGRSALTSRGYGNTGTLLEQLDRASTTNLDARLTGTTRAQVTEQLLQEVSDPHHFIDQSNRGTCTVTTITHRLASQNPAEYARIATDLATTGRSRLANGDTIQPPADAWSPDTSTRSPGERLVQSALMNYGRPGGNYRNATDQFSDGSSGLVADEQVRVLQGVHGRSYEHYTGSWNFRDDSRDILNRTRQELNAGRPVHTRFTWGNGGHVVEVTEIRDGRVYFRNPWGGDRPGINTDVGPNGTTLTNPPVRTDDARNGIMSMSEADYLRLVRGIVVPD